MKKLLFILCFVPISFKTFAANNCSNPNTILHPFLDPTWPCGYTNDATINNGNTFCYQKARGNLLYQDFQNCQKRVLGAPINDKLIFLIIAGIGLGVYMSTKQANYKAKSPL